MVRRILTFTCLLCFIATDSFADRVYSTVQTAAATLLDDSDIDENSPTTKRGTAAVMELSENGLDGDLRYFLLDDPSSEDSLDSRFGVILDSLTCALTVNALGFVSANDKITIDLYGVSRTWVESQVTWNKFENGGAPTNWTIPGATGEFDAELQQSGWLIIEKIGSFTDSLRITVLADGVTYKDSIDHTADDVLLHFPASFMRNMQLRNNKGALFFVDSINTTDGFSITFCSADNGTSGDRPQFNWYHSLVSYSTTQSAANSLISDNALNEGVPTQENGGVTSITITEAVTTNDLFTALNWDFSVQDSIDQQLVFDSTVWTIQFIAFPPNVGDSVTVDFVAIPDIWTEMESSWDSVRVDTLWDVAGSGGDVIQAGFMRMLYHAVDTMFITIVANGDSIFDTITFGLGEDLVVRLPDDYAELMLEEGTSGFALVVDPAETTDGGSWKYASVENATQGNRPFFDYYGQNLRNIPSPPSAASNPPSGSSDTIFVIGGNGAATDEPQIDDAYLYQKQATTAQGGKVNLLGGASVANGTYYSIVKYLGLADSMMTNHKTDSAQFGFVLSSRSGQIDNPIEPIVRRVLRNWIELECTYTIFSTGNNWTTAGAASEGNDIGSDIIGNRVRVNTGEWGDSIVGSSLTRNEDTIYIELDPTYVDSVVAGDFTDFGIRVAWEDEGVVPDSVWRIGYRASEYNTIPARKSFLRVWTSDSLDFDSEPNTRRRNLHND